MFHDIIASLFHENIITTKNIFKVYTNPLRISAKIIDFI
jgi:hypothetical protein